MDWRALGESLIGHGLPLLGGVLGGPAGSTIGTLVASALGCEATPEAVDAAVQGDPDQTTLILRKLELDHKLELEQLFIRNAADVNATIRTEVASHDAYVRRMRPTFGYLVALSIFAMIGIGGYAVIAAPETLPGYASFIGVVNIPLTAALAVLGVYVKQRSNEKRLDSGAAPGPSLLSQWMGGK